MKKLSLILVNNKAESPPPTSSEHVLPAGVDVEVTADIHSHPAGPAGAAIGIGAGFLFQLGEALYDSARKPAIPNAPPGFDNIDINWQGGFH